MIPLSYTLSKLSELESYDMESFSEEEQKEVDDAIASIKDTMAISVDETARILLFRDMEENAIRHEIESLSKRADRIKEGTRRIKEGLVSWMNANGMDTIEGDAYSMVRNDSDVSCDVYGPSVKDDTSFENINVVSEDGSNVICTLDKSDKIASILQLRKTKEELLRKVGSEFYRQASEMSKEDDDIKSSIVKTMRKNCISKLKRGSHSFGLKTSNSVSIDCQVEELPKEYQRVTIEPSKTDIKKAFDNGVSVPGCHLESKYSLVVR